MLCGQNEWIAYASQSPDIRELIKEKTSEVTKFIEDNAVNFFELGNKIFVHSWIPCKIKGNDCTWNPVYEKPYDWYNQDKVSLDEKAQKLYNSEWSSARWGNPFLMWKNKLYPEGKCIVFGHYHCSYGHSRLDMKCKEWPQVNQKNWTDCFKPWIKENAIQLGASNFLYDGNTFKIETNGNTSYSSTADIHLMPGMSGSTASGNGIVYVSGKVSANSLVIDGIEINPRGLTAVFG
jgi:hypothetical protein